KLLPFETRRDIYQLFIVPHFDYCSEVWHFCSKTLTDKLEKVNERAIRFVYQDKRTSYTDLLKRLGSTTLCEKRLGKIVTTVFKAIHKENSP
ncbi:hypothetical protein AC249_AIPGENE13506, partial [Exaiptasia diaphana]